MELKYSPKKMNIIEFKSSNRTFMELKYGRIINCCNGANVLIVPLWN